VIGITDNERRLLLSSSRMVISESSSGAKTVHAYLSRVMLALQRSPVVSYVLDSEFRVMYCNPAWNRFARLNGAPQLATKIVVGSDLFDSIPEILRAAYSDAFQQVLSTGKVWEKTYECSSPTLFRIFRMRIHLLKARDWFVVTNALVVERPHSGMATNDPDRYVDRNGLITMCAHCRCSRRVDSPDHWDFVPEYLQPLESVRVSHGLCAVCRAYFYHLE
jgi:hypothetical protein